MRHYSSRYSYRLARRVALCVAVVLSATFTLDAQPSPRAWITVLSTTDLHGNVLPVDYFADRPDARGLAKIASLVRQARAENPTGTLLIDSGDTIHGTPVVQVHNAENPTLPNPMVLAMNAIGFDAMAIGNHEYSFGRATLEKARQEARFPWLSANTYKTSSGEPAYARYVVKSVSGVRVGVLGLTTPGVPSWEKPSNYAGVEFREPVAEARKWVGVLRRDERVEVVVVAMHMGLEEELATGAAVHGIPGVALALARQVPGIDLVAMGHTHRLEPSLIVNGVLLMQAGEWGRHLARADMYLEKDDAQRWQIVARGARTIPVSDATTVDAEIAALAAPYDRAARAWLNRVIGESAAELDVRDATFRDTAILDLVQHVQLDAGQADVSMAASLNPQARLPKGPVTVRDVSGLYPYENGLVVLEVTGRQLKEALEHSARYFGPYVAGRTPAELVDPRMLAENFEVAEGVSYHIDITRPPGDRIVALHFRGLPLEPTQLLRLATNSYRAGGGGGYWMYKGAREVYRSHERIRELIVAWVTRYREIAAQPSGNWRLVASRD